MRLAIAQMTSGIDPARNAESLTDAAAQAAGEGADILFTPEMTGLLDRNRERAAAVIASEAGDVTLAAAREAAAKHGIWVALGSLALTDEEAGDKWVNRSFMIDGDGDIRARYDKIHLFDVDLATGESWKESASFAHGKRAVITAGPGDTRIGLSICYDLRFPALYAELSNGGAQLLSVPAAFTAPTGMAHWHVLLRARAIEAGCFVVAAAQHGKHEDGRTSYGHSLVVDPWGEVLLDMGEAMGVGVCDVDFDRIADIRGQVPAIHNRRDIPPAEIVT